MMSGSLTRKASRRFARRWKRRTGKVRLSRAVTPETRRLAEMRVEFEERFGYPAPF